MSRAEIKAKSKAMLGGKIFATLWLMAVVVELIYGAAMSVPNIIPAIGTIVAFVITGPLEFGKNLIFFKLAGGSDKVELSDLLEGFKSKDLTNLILLGVLRQIFTVLWTLLFIIPGIVKSYAYSMAMYIKNDHPDYDWRKCLDASQAMMKGKKWTLFVQDLSFIGWLFLGAICCGIGTLFVLPYIDGARLNFYEANKG